MWHPFQNTKNDRGGFQDRDVGRSSNLSKDYGPDFGTDYARFNDPPDASADLNMKLDVLTMLSEHFPDLSEESELFVRNGFVFIKFRKDSTSSRNEIKKLVLSLTGVREVIIQDLH